MNVGIVGLGLIGASFARALQKKTDCAVYGFDVDDGVMKKALSLNVIDGVLDENTAKTVDLLVLALYPKDMESAAAQWLPLLKDGATVTDFCGNKRQMTAQMKKWSERFPSLCFWSCHPMAGRELSGINASRADLFDGASMLVVPVTPLAEQWKTLFLRVGFSEVVTTTAEEHDANVAYTSQLCHIVSNAFIKSPTAEKHFGYSAGSYKDLTRVARLSADMWAQLMTENADNLATELKLLTENLQKYLQALEERDEEQLKELLQEGNARKIAIDVVKK